MSELDFNEYIDWSIATFSLSEIEQQELKQKVISLKEKSDNIKKI
jgi:hypothetical protein